MQKHKFELGQIILFLFWPFGSFLISVATLNKTLSKIIFVLFAILYGYSFTFDDASGADNGRMASEYMYISNMTVKNALSYFNETDSHDFFKSSTFIFFSRFTKDPGVVYGFYAGLYATFFILCISKLFDNYRNKRFASLVTILLFLLYLRFSSINGVRFWSAAFIYIYGVYKVVYERNLRYLLLLAATPLIHFSFMFGLAVVGTYFVIGHKTIYCYALLLVSVLLPTEFLKSYLYKYSSFDDEIDSYGDYAERRAAIDKYARPVFSMAPKLVHNFIPVALFIPRLFSRKIIFGEKELRLYNFLIIFLSFLTIVSFSYELYRRFFELFVMLVIMFIFHLMNDDEFYFVKPFYMEALVYVTALALLPAILVGLRSGLESLNIELLYKSAVLVPVFGNMSVIDFIDLYFR